MSDRPSVSDCRALLTGCDPSDLPGVIDSLSDDPRAGVMAAVEAARRRVAATDRETARLESLLELERSLMGSGAAVVAGLDEVGRGALAGPVTAAAVVLGACTLPRGLNDSKKLTPAKRTDIAARIRDVCVACCVAHIPAERIDEIGIGVATRQAMVEALAGLSVTVDHVIVDGLPVWVHSRETAVVGGDAKVACIAAASVIAKVERDALMVRFAEEYEGWAFDVNKGYGTSEHISRLMSHGPTAIHRRSFTPGGGTPALW